MPIKPDREYRNLQIRAEENENEPENEAKVVTGYASTFEEPYLLYDGEGWRLFEVVDRGAFDNTDMSDVIMQYDHAGRVFARTRNNTLEVETDDKGLFIKADLSGTEIGRELYAEIRGGYTDRMSFGFTVRGDYEIHEQTEDGAEIYTRHITDVAKLYDVSAVSIPANDGTSIGADATARSIGDLSNGLIERIRAERLEAEKTELERRKVEVRAKALLGGAKE